MRYGVMGCRRENLTLYKRETQANAIRRSPKLTEWGLEGAFYASPIDLHGSSQGLRTHRAKESQ
jgi:hypothetical protein